MATKIEWCDETINPVVGCSKCSPGCDNCYAEKFAARLAKHPNPLISEKYAAVIGRDGKWNGNLTYVPPSTLGIPKKKRQAVFVGSMTDLFHEQADYQLLTLMLKVLIDQKKVDHKFLILTKRPGTMKSFILQFIQERKKWRDGFPDFIPGLWLGVTVCNQQEADEKIPLLLATPAAHRFISLEPMLGPIDLAKFLPGDCDCEACLFGHGCHQRLNWVIAGGETGPRARPMHPDWVRSIRDQCREAQVPFFFKGWGEWSPCENKEWHGLGPTGRPPQLAVSPQGETAGGFLSEQYAIEKGEEGWLPMKKVGKKLSGRFLDGLGYNQRPWESEQ